MPGQLIWHAIRARVFDPDVEPGQFDWISVGEVREVVLR
jgi:hypothetical protein